MPDLAFDAAVFDLDGTLLDTLKDLADAMNRVLGRHGYPTHPQDAYRYFVGEGARLLVTRTLPETERTDPTIERVLADFMQDYGTAWNVATRPYPGIPELLAALHERGVRLAVLSNKPHPFTVSCTHRFFPDHPFDLVYGQLPEFPRKPDPTTALRIAAEFGAPPERCLYLGDTATDMQTACRAGMAAVGVLWGFRPADELTEHGAAVLIETPHEAVGLLDGRFRTR